MKKTLSLLLAIVMMLSVLVIPAAAAAPEDDVLDPCATFMDCPQCGTSAYLRNTLKNQVKAVTVSKCSNKATSHVHYKTYDQYIIDCTYCGTVTKTVYTADDCIYG